MSGSSVICPICGNKVLQLPKSNVKITDRHARRLANQLASKYEKIVEGQPDNEELYNEILNDFKAKKSPFTEEVGSYFLNLLMNHLFGRSV